MVAVSDGVLGGRASVGGELKKDSASSSHHKPHRVTEASRATIIHRPPQVGVRELSSYSTALFGIISSILALARIFTYINTIIQGVTLAI